MGATIHDEFYGSGMSRQQVWMLRKKRDGRCLRCGARRASNSASYCAKHRDWYRAYLAAYKREHRGMVRS